MQLPKKFTTVTPLSKLLTVILFVTLPFIVFYLRGEYQKTISLDNTGQQNVNCVSLTLPKYKLAKAGDFGGEEGDQEMKFIVDLNNDNHKELVQIYNERIYSGHSGSRTLPVIIKVFSGTPDCYKEEFSFGGNGTLFEDRVGNEIEEAKIFYNFWGDNKEVLMFNLILTGYGSGATSYMNFLTYQNGSYKIIEGPTLSGLSAYKFLDPDIEGKQILVAEALFGEEEAHFDPHRMRFERWDWIGERYQKTELGTTKNKYENLGISIDKILQDEPDVFILKDYEVETEITPISFFQLWSKRNEFLGQQVTVRGLVRFIDALSQGCASPEESPCGGLTRTILFQQEDVGSFPLYKNGREISCSWRWAKKGEKNCQGWEYDWEDGKEYIITGILGQEKTWFYLDVLTVQKL